MESDVRAPLLPSHEPPPKAWLAYLVDMEVAKTGRWFVDALAKSFDFRKNARDIFVRAPLAGAARLAPLDGVRALAFMWVSADHAMKTIETDIGASSCVFLQRAVSEQTASAWLCTFITYWADFGVTLFFVLSGFLIVYILVDMDRREEGGMSYPRFVARRFFRIWPSLNAYWLVSMPFFLYLVPQAQNWYAKYVKVCVNYGWTNLVFATNFGECIAYDLYTETDEYDDTGTCQDHLWTVSTEFQMYLVTPAFARLYLWREDAGMLAAALAGAGATAWAFYNARLQNVEGADLNCYLKDTNSPLFRIGEYAMGLLCCMSYLSSRARGDEGRWRLLDVPFRRAHARFSAWWARAAVGALVVAIIFGCVVVLTWGSVRWYGDRYWDMYMIAGANGTYTPLHIAWAAVVALVIRVSLDPDLGTAVAWTLGASALYPLASLSYTGYLFSYVPGGWAFDALEEATGCSRDVDSIACWLSYYVLFFAFDLVLAFALSMLVERPLMRFGKLVTEVPRMPAAPEPTPRTDAPAPARPLRPTGADDMP